MLNYFKNLTWEQAKKITIGLIFSFILLSFGISLYKYLTFGYNALDLAIFNQVFYNSALGDLFNFTIHPTSYLADHFGLIIIFLLPFYFIYKSAISLLLLQSLFLGLAAIPLYLIAKKNLSPLLGLLAILLYLFNPVTFNISLFEFHLLTLVPFFIFWVFYFYQKNNFPLFLLLSIGSLLIREDVAFIIFMFGIIAFLDKKKLKFILTPLILAPVYFFTALKIIGYFSPAETYKFLAYYAWLGETPQEIFINFFLKFHLVLGHLFTIANLELILGFGLVFLFIPFYRPKYLLLALGIFMQIILGFASGELILRTHYGITFLTAMSLAVIFALPALSKKIKTSPRLLKRLDIIVLFILTGLVYNFLVLGPPISFIYNIIHLDTRQIELKKEFIAQIPPRESLITTYDLISSFSSRQDVYSLNYVFLGKQQYGVADYIVPKANEYLLINFDDFVTYHLQYQEKAEKYYYGGDDNLRKLIAENDYRLVKISQNMGLWQKNTDQDNILLYELPETLPVLDFESQNLNDKLEFLGIKNKDNQTSLYFKTLNKIEHNYFIKINAQLYVLGYGIYPTSQWPENKIIKINFFDLPEITSLEIIDIITGGLELNGIGSTKNIYDQIETIGVINLD